MANSPLQNLGTFFQNTYTQAGLMGGGVLGTAVGIGAGSSPSLAAAGVLALGGGAALMAHQRLSALRQSGAPRSELPLSQSDIPDETFRNNLHSELAERYAVLADPMFAPLRGMIVDKAFAAFAEQGRPVDAHYPQLRGCVTEFLVETEVAKVVESLAGATGVKERLRKGLENDLGNRARRWAPLRVEESIAAALRSAYPIFENKDYTGMVPGMAKRIFDEWFRQGSPAQLDKAGPATPLVDGFVHAQVKGLMDALTSKASEPKFATLLRELRRSERRRSLESSTLFTRLRKATRELEILSSSAAQLKFPNDDVRMQVANVVAALRDAPEVASKDELDRFTGFEGKPGQEGHVRDLAARLVDVRAKANEARTKEESALSERLKSLQQIVVGTGAVAGLDAASVGALHPELPEWVQNVTLRLRDAQGGVADSRFTLGADGTFTEKSFGIELAYRDGGWWIRDGRVLATLNPLNWIRAFTLNGRKLAAGGRWPVHSGDRLQASPAVEIEFVLPDEPPLERLRLRIARIASLEDLATLLRDNNQRSLAQQIATYLKDGGDFADVPQAGGLRAKLTDLVLRRETAILHERYFLGLSYLDAETAMSAIARSVAASENVAGLAEAVRVSRLPEASKIADAIAATATASQNRTFDDIPTAFGIREHLILLLRENERQLRARMGELGGQVSRLSQALREANQGIANRDDAIRKSSEREANLNKELERARQSLTEQARQAQAEKTKILAEHAAVIERVRVSRQKLVNEHAAELRLEREKAEAAAKEHQRLQDQKDADHVEALRQKGEEMERQEAEYRRLQTEKDTAHQAAEAKLREAQAAELRQRDMAFDELRQSGLRALAERDEQRVQEIQALNIAHTGAMLKLAEDHKTVMAELRTNHATARSQIEEKRAAAEREAKEIQGRLDALQAEKTAVERVREEKETARAAAQAEVERLTGVERDLRASLAEKSRELAESNRTSENRRLELEETSRKLAEKNVELGQVTEERTTAQRRVNQIEEELRLAQEELKRLLDEELPKLERRLEAATREKRDMWSAITDYDHTFAVYIDQLREAVQTGAEAARVEQYLAKLEEIKGKLDQELARAGEEKTATSRASTEPDMAVEDSDLLIEDPADAANDAVGAVDAASSEIPPPIFDEPPPSAALPEEVTKVEKRPAAPTAPTLPAASEAPTTSQRQRILGPYFGAVDPRTLRVEDFKVMGTRDLHDMDGTRIGHAWIRGGDLRDDTPYSHTFADGSILSAKTSIGVPKKPKPGESETQEDGLYVATYRLPDGREVKILAGADGAGGMGGGDLASSAFLQGVHAAIHEAAAKGLVLTAGELFTAGNEAILRQKSEADRPKAAKATGSGAVVVIIGNQATIATVGDATVVHARRQSDGSYKAQGYSDVNHMGAMGIPELQALFGLPAATSQAITKGIGQDDARLRAPELYVVDLKPGDRFLFGSDGMHENVIGRDYKNNGSALMRNHAGRAHVTVPPMTRGNLTAYEKFCAATAGSTDAGALLHDLALHNMQIDRPGNGAAASFPRPMVELNGVAIQLPVTNNHDNIFGGSYEHGDVADASPARPAGYRALESLWSPFIGGADPRTEPIEVAANASSTILGRNGAVVGGFAIAAGGVENRLAMKLSDGSFFSAQTSMGVSKNNRQEDGYYSAMYNLPDGTPIKVMAVADGAGGEGQKGYVASSAFLQGVHAALAEAAYSGRSDLTADELFQAGIEAAIAQNSLTADGFAQTTGSVVVMVGNRAMVATVGNTTVFYAVPQANGALKVMSYSNADVMSIGGKTQTGLIGRLDEDGGMGHRPHLYVIDNVPHGAFFVMATDGVTPNLLGAGFEFQASENMRKIGPMSGHGHIHPPTDETMAPLNQILSAASGTEHAALAIHNVADTVMRAPVGTPAQTIPVMNAPISVPAKTEKTNDNLGVATLQHHAGNYPATPAPAGYGAMPEVVAVSDEAFPNVELVFRTDRVSGHGEFLTLGRMEGVCDEAVPHKTVSRQHAHLVFNRQEQNGFAANTWYIRPISDNPNGTHVDGVPVPKDQWGALKPGVTLLLGGVPLLVAVGGADSSLRLMTHPNTPASRRSPVPAAAPSQPRVSPPPPPPSAARTPPASVRGAPPTPPSATPASTNGRPTTPPTMDAHGNIRLNRGQLIHVVATTDAPGFAKETKPGIWQLSIKKNRLMTDQYISFGIGPDGEFFFQKNVDDASIVVPGAGPAGADMPVPYNVPIKIVNGTFVRIGDKTIRLWLS